MMASTAQKTQRPALRALTGVRMLAALAVVAHHFLRPANIYLNAANEHGFIGVSLFFVLSGFILSYTYDSAPGTMQGTARSFWAARFARIYPMYVVAMILMAPVVLAWSTNGHLWQSALAAFALVHAWLPIEYCEWNPPGWSLSAEAIFYLVFPFAIKAVSAQPRARLLLLLLLFWAASLTAPAIYAIHGAIDRGFWMFNPIVRLPEFLIGVTAGVLWMQDERVRRVLPAYTAEISLAVLCAILCIPMHEGYVMNGACAPLILLMILDLASGRGPLAKLLGTRLFVALGGASYSLYIIHWPVWYEAKWVVSRLLPGLAPDTAFWIITLGVLIPSSYVCFRFIEEPLNKRLRKRFASMSTPASGMVQRSPVATADDVYDPTKGLS